MNMIPAHSPTQTLFPHTHTDTHTNTHRIRAFILPLGIWLFREAVSTSLPWSATSSSSDLSAHAAGLWAQQNQPKEQSTTINNGILRELRNTRRIRSRGDEFLMENNARCLVFAFWLICIETAEETAGKLQFTLRWTLTDILSFTLGRAFDEFKG